MEKAESPYFRPINKEHAIVEAVLFCEFAPPLSEQTIQRLANLEESEYLRKELPKFAKIESAQIQFNSEGSLGKIQSFDSKLAGFQMQRIKEDGTIGWMLNVTDISISIHCLDYTRWDEFWDRSKKIFDLVFNSIGISESKLASLGIKYVDRFIFEGEFRKEYDARLLLFEESSLIHKKAFDSGDRWHCHNGWFDSHTEFQNLEFLNQLNMDSAHVFIHNHRQLITTIEHTVSARINDSAPIDSEIPSFEDDQFDQLFKFMHESNKKTLGNLLTPNVKKLINLNI